MNVLNSLHIHMHSLCRGRKGSGRGVHPLFLKSTIASANLHKGKGGEEKRGGRPPALRYFLGAAAP